MTFIEFKHVCLLFTTYLEKRWNYSYICLSRLLEYYAIVVELTSKISKNDIPGIESEKIEALRKHFFGQVLYAKYINFSQPV